MGDKIIDMHMHVGLVGDKFNDWGYMSPAYRSSIVFKAFQLFARVKDHEVNDVDLHRRTVETIMGATRIDNVVLLALTPVYDKAGIQHKDRSNVWVSNEYIKQLCQDTKGKALFGASVHPYDQQFESKLAQSVEDGAVLLKWLPSVQQFNLADDAVLNALLIVAKTKTKSGKPLPLLLHIGHEHAIPTTDERTYPYDYLSWSTTDKFYNFFRSSGKKWFVPDLNKKTDNLKKAVSAGLTLILAHCGLPYYNPNWFSSWLGHSDLPQVTQLLNDSMRQNNLVGAGKVYADMSAFCQPVRQSFFKDIKKLPQERLLFGSDYPTPAFELSANAAENMEDLKAIMNGQTDRILIPEGNLLDVNERELRLAYGNASAFTNFSGMM